MKRMMMLTAIVGAAGSAQAQLSGGNTAEFQIPIPELGTEFFFGNGIIPGSNDFNGGEVIDVRLDLVLDVTELDPGDPRESSAAYFSTFVIVPIDISPALGNQFGSVIVTGEDEGWSGTGTFTISRTLDELIGGTWISPVFYSAETFDSISPDQIVAGTVNPFVSSFITVTVQNPAIPAPSALSALAIASVVGVRRRR